MLLSCSVVSFLALVSFSPRQEPAPRYEMDEVMIPMRDGVELHTKIFTPKLDEPRPLLLTRTPYGIGGVSVAGPATPGPSRAFLEQGYILVHQDVRGQFGSGGEWQDLRPPRDPADPAGTDERTDAFDTVAWLLANVAGNNGRAGMWGISYDGWQTAMAMSEAHPALVAVSPQASPGDMFVGDDIHHNGAFRLSYSFAWIGFMAAERGDADAAEIRALLRQDSYAFFRAAGNLVALEQRYFRGRVPEWSEILAHPDRDEYWARRNVVALLDDVRPAALHVAGWFDAEDFRGPLDIYRAAERGDDDGRNSLVIGPWRHGGWSPGVQGRGESLGALSFDQPTAEWYQDEVELSFFARHLDGRDEPRGPEVRAFETGANVWREFERWPPPASAPRALYLRAGGRASFEPPAADEAASEYESDPAEPVPYSAHETVFPGPLYMVEDQRFLEGRADVLSFVSEPLEHDLVLAGAPEVLLHVATSGTDADWIVKLIDVYPEEETGATPAERRLAGAWILLSGDILRAKYRDSFAHPTPLEPGRVTATRFALPDRLHRFRAGHCIGVQVHSTWFPLYDRNPQVYTDIYHASASDFRSATQQVFHRADAASRIVLPVLGE